jgi:hypothetical protein
MADTAGGGCAGAFGHGRKTGRAGNFTGKSMEQQAQRRNADPTAGAIMRHGRTGSGNKWLTKDGLSAKNITSPATTRPPIVPRPDKGAHNSSI